MARVLAKLWHSAKFGFGSSSGRSLPINELALTWFLRGHPYDVAVSFSNDLWRKCRLMYVSIYFSDLSRIHTFQIKAFPPANGIVPACVIVFPSSKWLSLGQVILTSKVLLGSKMLPSRGQDQGQDDL